MSTSPFVESIFDDNFRKPGVFLDYKLWVKPNSSPNPSEIVFCGYLYKKQKKSNAYKQRFYVLTPTQLFYFKVVPSNNWLVIHWERGTHVEFVIWLRLAKVERRGHEAQRTNGNPKSQD